MGVLPVVDNLLHVVEGVKQEVISPFIPVDGPSPIPVHTGGEHTGQGYQQITTHFCFITWCHERFSDSNVDPGHIFPHNYTVYSSFLTTDLFRMYK